MKLYTSHRLTIVIISVLFFVLPTGIALADIGPKPTLEFRFSYPHGKEMSPLSGELLGCEDSACLAPKSLEGNPYVTVRCEGNTCYAGMAFTSGPFRLKILFSDGQARLSNPFEAKSFDNIYMVKVQDQDMVVTRNIYLSNNAVWGVFLAVFPLTAVGLLVLAGGLVLSNRSLEKHNNGLELPFRAAPYNYILVWFLAAIALVGGAYFTWALPLTILIELGIAYLYYRKLPADAAGSYVPGADISVSDRKKFDRPTLLPLLTSVVTVNLITQPLLWASTGVLSGTLMNVGYWPLLILEVIVWLVEGVLLRITQYRHLRWGDAFKLSLFMNLSSFIIGLLFAL